ncbi:MAG: UDP-3-O-(3-hydroxymyristoyl)glucosamine N-acyltransferase [Saprospiraceae bacterium]|nr:UDP-3-O-(3-hydroxymyristoyl)glucosamine N-acyltransferase [Saprospiraceae bacterium]
MQVRAIDICQLLDGKLEGDPNVLVHKPAKIEEGEPGAISFLANPKYEGFAYTCKSSVLLVSKDFQAKQALDLTLIRVDDVYSSLSKLLEHFGNQQPATTSSNAISNLAFVHPSAEIGEHVTIDPFVYVGANSKIGAHTHLFAQAFVGDDVEIGMYNEIQSGAKICKGSILGNYVVIHPNAVIGSDGFGFAPQPDGSFKKIPQLGIVHLGNYVEIGAGTTIDRATIGKTVLEDGVKLDNLIQMGHNTTVGKDTVIAAQAGIAGSTKIGKNCMIGGQAGFVGHLHIADGTKVQAKSGVAKSIKKPNQAIQGAPAMDYVQAMRMYVIMRNLPDLQKRIELLEEELKELRQSK